MSVNLRVSTANRQELLLRGLVSTSLEQTWGPTGGEDRHNQYSEQGAVCDGTCAAQGCGEGHQSLGPSRRLPGAHSSITCNMLDAEPPNHRPVDKGHSLERSEEIACRGMGLVWATCRRCGSEPPATNGEA